MTTRRFGAAVLFALVACAPEDRLAGRRPSSGETLASAPATTVWASPGSLPYKTVLHDGNDHPDFTVYIERSDGSAALIDPASVTLNGHPALPHPSALGDDDGNGIPDLMVKFDRSVFAGNPEGGFYLSGSTPAGRFTAQGQVHVCEVIGVERTTYFLGYTTSDMPDPSLDGLQARIEVRRVKPVFSKQDAACEGSEALVMLHGRTIEALSTFDLDYQDYSLMEGLARRGIDTFAFNSLGFGGSSLVDPSADPLINACNASLPQCAIAPGTQCAPAAGVCDCQGLPPAADQQAQAIPNPLAQRCAHTSTHAFQSSDNQVADLGRVVDDVKARTGGRVNLLGYSAGGPVAGVYLSDPARQAKIDKAIFMSSLFAQTDVPPAFPNWPLGFNNRGNIQGAFIVGCTDQVDSRIVDQVWASLKSSDAVGGGWGAPGVNGGLNRFPIVARAGWNAAASRKISTPMLVLHGSLDTTVPGTAVVQAKAIVRNSPPAGPCASSADCGPGYTCETGLTPAVCRLDNRIYTQVPCASHPLLWESPAHVQVRKYLGDYLLRGVISAP